MSDLKNSKKQKPYAAKLDISRLFGNDDNGAIGEDLSSKKLIKINKK